MNLRSTNQAQSYCNVMEFLVNQEIEKQLQNFPSRVANSINNVEVITYAVNRLPALYASSENGWQHQISRGREEFGKQITVAVRQALAAVQRDPLRMALPLPINEEVESQVVLQTLKDLLQNEQLSWNNLVSVIEQTLVKTVQGEITWKSKRHIPGLGYNWNDNRYCR